MNGAGTTAQGTSEGVNVQQPAYSAPQLQASGRGAYSSTSSSAPASASGQVASIQKTAMSGSIPQQALAAPSLPSAAVTVLQSPAAQLMTSPPAAPSQGSSITSHNTGQQLTEGQSSAAHTQMGQQQVAGSPLQKSANEAQQTAATTQSVSTTATSRQQAGLAASQDTSLATASAEDGSKQQVHKASPTPCR